MAFSSFKAINSEDNLASTTALFITKVWNIVNQEQTNSLISWTESGKTFIVHQESSFSKKVLPHYFRHSNFASFVRQLNLYGFRKVAKPDHGGLTSIQDESVEFWHTNFRRAHPELLPLVQKRPVGKQDDKNPIVSRLMADIHQMKEKQESIATVLDDLKDENYCLKQEIVDLKSKHDVQHKILNKIIHFVIQMISHGNRMPSRKNRLMLTGTEDTELLPLAKRSTNVIDTFDNIPSSPMLYDVTSPDIPTITSIPPSPIPFVFDQSSSASFGQPQDNLSLLPMMSDDMTDPPCSNRSLIDGDEFLANLFKPSTTDTSLQSQMTPVLTQAQIDSQHQSHSQYQSPQYSSSLLSQQSQPLLQTNSNAQTQSQSLNNQSQPQTNTSQSQSQSSSTQSQPQSQSVDLVPYNRMNSLATHLQDCQVELDSLPGTLFDQLNIDPLAYKGLFSVDQQIPEYDIVDTARLLESFLDPNNEKDVCHESTVQVTAPIGLSTLALPSGEIDDGPPSLIPPLIVADNNIIVTSTKD